ncbi:sugar porter family MFS transporter [Candidatus Cetobacterium colombiensis]|uniref:Sugar porter family MFS transporter n=1 Tax=Candidatus Cetobacterium colombiensis TaxID=3073100 RepID=A0ABU4W9J0_9FUSO|nr:sugar porter family MFS transporter [Candidatus Cetobacterium colombiensis]MDX8336181.1 sugar porter family MFS transporter [Candidatus Cetobacterium colombiensis]
MKYKKAIISAFIAGSAGFVLGYDMGISGGTINNVSTHFNLNSAWEGFALSVFIVGAVLGSLFTKRINDDFGRKKALIIGTVLMLVGALGVYIFGDKFKYFMFYRGIAGAGMGLLFSSEPSYVTEISPSSIRGGLGSILQFTTGIGIIVGYSVTFIMLKEVNTIQDNNWMWKTIYGTEAIIVGIYLMFLFYIVNSPVWFLLKKKDDEAIKVMKEIWPDIDPQKFIAAHSSYSRNDDETKNIEHQMEKSGKLKKLIFIAFFMSALTELCGINPLIYYSSDIFRKIMPEGPDTAFYQSIINGLFFTVGSLISMLTVDKFGRKTLLFVGTFIMSTSLFIIGIHIYMNSYSMLLVYLVYLFIFSYNFSAGAIRFLYIGELSPTPLRAYTLGFAGIINWISDFLVSWTLPIIANSIFLNRILKGSSIFFIYSIFGFIFFILVFTIPETKGKSLHELSKYWSLEDD